MPIARGHFSFDEFCLIIVKPLNHDVEKWHWYDIDTNKN